MRTSFFMNLGLTVFMIAVLCLAIDVLFLPKSSMADNGTQGGIPYYKLVEGSDQRAAASARTDARSAIADARLERAVGADTLAAYNRIAAEAAQCRKELAELRTATSAIVDQSFTEPPNAICVEDIQVEDCMIQGKPVKCEIESHICITLQPTGPASP